MTSLPATPVPARKYPALERKAIGADINRGVSLGLRHCQIAAPTIAPNRSSAIVPALVTNRSEAEGIDERGRAIDRLKGFNTSWKLMEMETRASAWPTSWTAVVSKRAIMYEPRSSKDDSYLVGVEL